LKDSRKAQMSSIQQATRIKESKKTTKNRIKTKKQNKLSPKSKKYDTLFQSEIAYLYPLLKCFENFFDNNCIKADSPHPLNRDIS